MVVNLASALADLKEEEALKITRERLSSGEDPQGILNDARKALVVVGQRFEKGEYFIPDLVYSGEILKEITEIIKPELTKSPEFRHVGKFVIGTVAGDIHDLGKNIVAFMLDVNGFEVHDLGVDVPAQKFVEKIREVKPDIVGLSGFLSMAFATMKDTIEAIKAAGMRNKVKIMVGGGLVDDEVRKYTGADAYRPDAMSAVILAREWAGDK